MNSKYDIPKAIKCLSCRDNLSTNMHKSLKCLHLICNKCLSKNNQKKIKCVKCNSQTAYNELREFNINIPKAKRPNQEYHSQDVDFGHEKYSDYKYKDHWQPEEHTEDISQKCKTIQCYECKRNADVFCNNCSRTYCESCQHEYHTNINLKEYKRIFGLFNSAITDFRSNSKTIDGSKNKLNSRKSSINDEWEKIVQKKADYDRQYKLLEKFHKKKQTEMSTKISNIEELKVENDYFLNLASTIVLNINNFVVNSLDSYLNSTRIRLKANINNAVLPDNVRDNTIRDFKKCSNDLNKTIKSFETVFNNSVGGHKPSLQNVKKKKLQNNTSIYTNVKKRKNNICNEPFYEGNLKRHKHTDIDTDTSEIPIHPIIRIINSISGVS